MPLDVGESPSGGVLSPWGKLRSCWDVAEVPEWDERRGSDSLSCFSRAPPMALGEAGGASPSPEGVDTNI